MKWKHTKYEGKRRDWSGVELKSDHQEVSAAGRAKEKSWERRTKLKRTGQQQEPEESSLWQGLWTYLEGSCRQVMRWAVESSWLDCVRCWQVAQPADQAGRLNSSLPVSQLWLAIAQLLRLAARSRPWSSWWHLPYRNFPVQLSLQLFP